MAKLTVLISTLIVILLGAGLYFFLVSVPLDNSLRELKINKEKEFKAKLKQERELIRNELADKYKADTESYEAMAKVLEAAKERGKQSQEKPE